MSGNALASYGRSPPDDLKASFDQGRASSRGFVGSVLNPKGSRSASHASRRGLGRSRDSVDAICRARTQSHASGFSKRRYSRRGSEPGSWALLAAIAAHRDANMSEPYRSVGIAIPPPPGGHETEKVRRVHKMSLCRIPPHGGTM